MWLRACAAVAAHVSRGISVCSGPQRLVLDDLPVVQLIWIAINTCSNRAKIFDTFLPSWLTLAASLARGQLLAW